MAVRSESMSGDEASLRTLSVDKFLRDVATVVEIQLLYYRRYWYWFLIGSLVFPASIFYWSRALAPEDAEAVRRLLTGAIVFGISLMTANNLAQQLYQDRFNQRLKLLITAPMAKAAYGAGVLAFAVIISASTVAVLLAFAVLAGVEFTLHWTFLPLGLTVLLTMAGLTLFIASFAPNAQVGNIMTNLLGILLVFVSPVFFPLERAPALLQAVGWLSPLRYAADGMMKSLSGRADIGLELMVLAGFATVMMTLGLWKLRWRES